MFISENKNTYFNLNNFKLVHWVPLPCGSEIKLLGNCSNYRLLVNPLKLSLLATPIQILINLWGRQLIIPNEAAQNRIFNTGRWKCLKHHSFLYFILVDPPPSLPILSVLSPSVSSNSLTWNNSHCTKISFQTRHFNGISFFNEEKNPSFSAKKKPHSPFIWMRMLCFVFFIPAFNTKLLSWNQSLDTTFFFWLLFTHHRDKCISHFNGGTETKPWASVFASKLQMFLLLLLF